VPASLGCGRASSSLLQFTVVVLFSVLLYYYSTFTFRCHVMGFSVLEVVGFTAIVSLTVFVLNELWKFLYTTRIGYALGKTISLKDIGEWAIVTGATDGIGRAYAEELAALGLNVVLISRSPYKLQNVAAEIETKYHVKTLIIDVDFTAGNEIYERIGKEIEGLEIGVLINNVGMSYSYPEYLAQVPNTTEFAHSLINCNVVSVTRMCLLVLEKMVQRKKGLILNISSASAVLPTPLMTMYSSTKAFVLKFTEDLALEYTPFGLTIQCVLPGFVATNMSRIKRPCMRAPLPKHFVKEQMKTLGLEHVSAGYWVHKLQLGYYTKLMRVFPALVLHVTYTNLVKTRLRALKRLEEARQRQQQQQQSVESAKEK